MTNIEPAGQKRRRAKATTEPEGKETVAVTVGDAGVPTVQQVHTDFVAFHEGYLGRQVSMADAKASAVLGIATAVLAFFLSQNRYHVLIFSPEWSLDYVALVVALALMVLTAGTALFVIWPRLGTKEEGLVFFGSVIVHGSGKAYLDSLLRQDEAALTSARIHHCYNLSLVCVGKYRALRLSLVLGFVAVTASLVALGVSSGGSP